MAPATLSVVRILQTLAIWQSAEEENEIFNKVHNFLLQKPGVCKLLRSYHAEHRAVSSSPFHWRTVCHNILLPELAVVLSWKESA